MKIRIPASPILALALLPLLAACATVLTPERCETALGAARTAQDIIAVLVARGVEPEIAAKIAAALAVGEVAVGAACAAAR